MNMKVNVAKFRRKEGESARFKLREDFSGCDLGTDGLSFQTPVDVQFQVTNTDKELLVYGTVQTELLAVCGRCLSAYEYPLQFSFHDEWVFPEQATESILETALLLDKDEVEVKERVFEQILLALPMKFVCSADCQGLCPVCGVNRNLETCQCEEDVTDPRLAVLEKWQVNSDH